MFPSPWIWLTVYSVNEHVCKCIQLIYTALNKQHGFEHSTWCVVARTLNAREVWCASCVVQAFHFFQPLGMPEKHHYYLHCEEFVSLSTIDHHKQLFCDVKRFTWQKSATDEIIFSDSEPEEDVCVVESTCLWVQVKVSTLDFMSISLSFDCIYKCDLSFHDTSLVFHCGCVFHCTSGCHSKIQRFIALNPNKW